MKIAGQNGQQLAPLLAGCGIALVSVFMGSQRGHVEVAGEETANRVRGVLVAGGFTVTAVKRCGTTAGKTWLVGVAV